MTEEDVTQPVKIRQARDTVELATKFDTGTLSPLTVVLDTRRRSCAGSEGLALIDDVSRFLARQQRIRGGPFSDAAAGKHGSAGSRATFERLRAVNAGHLRMEAGSRQLQQGLNLGAAKLRAAFWLEARTGIPMIGSADATCAAVASNLKQAWGGRLAEHSPSSRTEKTVQANDPAQRVAPGIDPRCRRCRADRRGSRSSSSRGFGDARKSRRSPGAYPAHDHPETVRDHPELRRSFDAYIAADGHRARSI